LEETRYKKGKRGFNKQKMRLYYVVLDKLEKNRFSFTGYLHCSRCGTGLLIIDNKTVSCPECELLRDQEVPNVEPDQLEISQKIF